MATGFDSMLIITKMANEAEQQQPVNMLGQYPINKQTSKTNKQRQQILGPEGGRYTQV